MADKVISEFKVVETDDGYRIEIKGDKEKMKQWMEHRGGMGRHGGFGFGPGRFMRHFFGMRHHGPWGRGPWGQGWDEEEAPPAADKPRA